MQGYEAQESAQEGELYLPEHFGADVGNVVSRCNRPQGNGAIGNTLTYVVMMDVNMLHITVLHRVLGEQLSTSIVNE